MRFVLHAADAKQLSAVTRVAVWLRGHHRLFPGLRAGRTAMSVQAGDDVTCRHAQQANDNRATHKKLSSFEESFFFSGSALLYSAARNLLVMSSNSCRNRASYNSDRSGGWKAKMREKSASDVCIIPSRSLLVLTVR